MLTLSARSIAGPPVDADERYAQYEIVSIVDSGVPASANVISCALSWDGLAVDAPVESFADEHPKSSGGAIESSTTTAPLLRVSSDHHPAAGYALGSLPGFPVWIVVTLSLSHPAGGVSESISASAR